MCLVVILLNSKSVQLSQQDRIYIQRFLNDWHVDKTQEEVHQNFETELSFISLIQDSVLSHITGEQIPHVYFGNVCYYYRNRQGICYDRAILIEKILLFFHFPFRHVYIYFGENQQPGVTDFFKKEVKSHAGIEVKTQKGWMAIGTNANWLGIKGNGQLLTFFGLRKELSSTNGNPNLEKPASFGSDFWKEAGYKFRIIYGIYSRHGDFFTGQTSVDSTSLFTGRRHFLPDYNLRMLMYNL